MRVTERPRDSRMAASEAEAIPLPREDTTPPVTKTNLVMSKTGTEGTRKVEIVIIDSRVCYIAPMSTLAGKHIVLGLSGGIAAYKSAELCRALVKAGVTVQVVMTSAAEQFMTAVTLQALSGRPVYTSQWDAREANNMAHINLSRGADAIVVAPASADFLSKLLHGGADELLSLLCLARPIDQVPLIVAPAMRAARARAKPILPLDKLVMPRTGSLAS